MSTGYPAPRRRWPARVAGPWLLLTLAACGGGGGGTAPAPTPQADQSPVARFALSDGDGPAPHTVTFDASSSSDADGTIESYDWDFGDDATSTAGPGVSHTYTDTGTFTVTLRITDDDGRSASTSANVRVRGATVSGTIRIGAGSSVDSDVNDRLSVPVANNEFGQAQAIRVPADGTPLRLGGFVNLPGTGPDSGNFFTDGDPDDFFFVELTGDERIVLSIGDPGADLDLELYSTGAAPELLDASASTEPTEDLQVPGPGEYFLRVFAFEGASNYVLSIAEDGVLTGLRRRAKRISDPFVPGELLVAHGTEPAVQRYRISRARAGQHYRFSSADRGGARGGPAPPAMRLPGVRLPTGATIGTLAERRYRTLLAARAASREAGVAIAEVNVLRQPQRLPNDALYDLQWHYPAIALEKAWDYTTGREPGSPDVVVAVVDTGVLLDHPDLDASLLRDSSGRVVGFDFIQDAARANDGDGIDPDPNDAGDNAGGPGSHSYHGTHVAGTVAAESDNGEGVAGVSWGARLMPLRALGIDGGTTYDVMQAVRFAAGLSNASGTLPPVRADIINLSLGSDFYSEAEQRTLNEVRARGLFVVASAGNDSSTVPSYPAAYDGVLSVSASTINGGIAPYSNFGATIDLAAPGGDGRFDLDANGQPDGVVSTLGEDTGSQVEFGYAILQGTSMASPHVAGVIALMKSVYPGLTPGELDALLEAGELTDEAGVPGRDDRFGWGIVNAEKAVITAIDSHGGTLGPVVSISADTLNFQSFTEALDFTVSNLGDEPLTVEVTGNAPWLTVTAVDAAADGLGQYQAVVNRNGLADGNYSAVITVQPDDASGARTITVLMMVTSPDVDADAGAHYVIVVPPEGEDSVVAQLVTAANGEYTFSLRDVPPGDYLLFAGTDLDDDGFICDGGEACGAYPSLSSPAVFSVDAREQAEVAGQTFVSEFRTTATTTAAARPAAAGADRDRDGIALPARRQRQ